MLPDLEILPLENWPGTAMDGRNVVVKVEEWKTAWEVRKKILEVGGRLAEKWNRVFRWKDFLDLHLWSFEFIGAMGEWEPVNIIETLLVNRQFPSQGLKYLVRVRGSSLPEEGSTCVRGCPSANDSDAESGENCSGCPSPCEASTDEVGCYQSCWTLGRT